VDWREHHEKGHLLFGDSIVDVKMPEVANGFVSFPVQSGTFMVDGVYNGETSLAPPDGSRCPVFPSYWVQVTTGLDKQGRGQEHGLGSRSYALSLERAVFLTRHNVSKALVEERMFAQLLSPSLLVQEISVDDSKGSEPDSDSAGESNFVSNSLMPRRRLNVEDSSLQSSCSL
jgi:hypothetical protein